MARVVGAVLAAGAGIRMGGPKAELVVDGVRLVDRAAGVLAAAGCAEIVAVTRSHGDVAGARVVVNPEPARGMRSSLKLALDAADDLGADAMAVLLVDTPGVTASAARAVVEAWRPGGITVARYPAGRGHPIVMSLRLWRRALELAGPDEGARVLLRATPDVHEVEVDGDAADLDSPEDLVRWNNI